LKVLLAHPGTQYSHQLATQLYKRDMLLFFYTGLAYGKDSLIYSLAKMLPSFFFKKISNRFMDELPDRYIRRNILNEIAALLKLKFGFSSENVIQKRNKKFQEAIQEADIRKAGAVIGFDTSSWILAAYCRKAGIPFYLDISIGHPMSKAKIYNDILKIYPDWNFAIRQKDQSQIEIEQLEIHTATHIVVASHFSYVTYIENGIPSEKISINPYGVDSTMFVTIKKSNNSVIRFVFIGLADARKGLPVLLNAWTRLNSPNISLTIIGPVDSITKTHIRKHFPSVIIKGRVSFKEIAKLLPEYDVMVFPTFFEGFGLVIPEAMACGLPVITTTATCGPDFITPFTEGIIIEPGDESGLVNAMRFFIEQPEKIVQMGNAAALKAKHISWNNYGSRWEDILSGKKTIQQINFTSVSEN
jgi:glycosyltransferase involved in cell wall biosynthesis